MSVVPSWTQTTEIALKRTELPLDLRGSDLYLDCGLGRLRELSVATECEEFQPVRLSSGDFPERERIPIWREQFGRQMFLMDFEPAPETAFHADMTMRGMPGLILGCASFSPLCMRRPNELVKDGNDDIWLVVPSADCTISQRNLEISVGAGDAVVIDGGESSELTLHAEVELCCVHVNRAELASLVRNLDDTTLQTIPSGNEALQYFLSYRRFVEKDPGLANPELARLAANHLRDLVAHVIGPDRNSNGLAESRGLRAARLRVIKHHVIGNLNDPRLTVANVATRYGISPRYVQRLFEAEATTFSEFVLNQRLERAHRMLDDRTHLWRSIPDIALDAGFGDISYFNRAFRRRFGLAPGELRGNGRAAEVYFGNSTPTN